MKKERRMNRNSGCSLRGAVALVVLCTVPVVAAEVEITYEEPERFSDMAGRGSMQFHKPTFERFQREMAAEMTKLAAEYLPEGARLAVTVRDVDLAGELEPWRMDAGDVRVIRDIYPPRIKFHFEVLDAQGATLHEGVAQLSDMSFLWGVPTIRQRDEFHYEKELLRSWARRTLDPLE